MPQAPAETMAASSRIQICLFLVELVVAIGMAASTIFMLKILPYSFSRTSGIFSTLVGLWIIKSAVWALQSLTSRSAAGNDASIHDEDEANPYNALASCDAIQEKRMKANLANAQPKRKRVAFAGEEKVDDLDDGASQSKDITDAKAFLMEADAPSSPISFPLLAILATVLLQCAIRLLVIVQNVRRSLPWRRRRRRLARGNGSMIEFADIPFVIGRKMSSSGCSFHIFSFLNGWLECKDGDGDTDRDTPDALTDKTTVSLQAVSFDKVSIGSSHFVTNQPRKHPSGATSQQSWFGITFEDIDVGMTILLRKSRRAVDGARDVRSVTFRAKVKAFELGAFPRLFDRCKGIGIRLEVVANFDTNNTQQLSSECGGFSGFGISGNLSEFCMHRFTRNAQNSEQTIISWNEIQSSVFIQLRKVSSSEVGETHWRETASTLKFPSGFVVVGSSKHQNGETDSQSPSRPAYVNVGDFCCDNRFAMGARLDHLQLALESSQSLLQTLGASFIGSPSGTEKKKPSRRESVRVAELNAIVSTQIFALTAQDKDGLDMDCLSFGTHHSVLRWKDHAQRASDIMSETQGAKPILAVETNVITLQHELHSVHGDNSDTILDVVAVKRIKAELIHDGQSTTGGSKRCKVALGGIIVRADGEAVNKLAFIKKASANLERSAKEIKQELLINRREQTDNSPKQNKKPGSIGRFDISCDSVDAIAELLGPEDANTCDGRVRMTFLQGGAHMTILRCGSRSQRESIFVTDEQPSLPPGQLFDAAVKLCAQYYLIEAKVDCAEGSMTFSPHSSLPVVATSKSNQDQEVSLCGKGSKLAFKSALSLKPSLQCAARSISLSRAIHISCQELDIYERFDKGGDNLRVPVHEFPLGWRMAETHATNTDSNVVKLLHCNVDFCMVDYRSELSEEKKESISIQLRKGANDLAIVWSPISQWLQMSCNNRIQHALLRLKTLASNQAIKKPVFSTHRTNIRVDLDSQVPASIYAFIGVQTKINLVIEGGSMDISVAKHLDPSTLTLRQTSKPNIAFEARHIKVLLNDNKTPAFTIDGLSLNNYVRRASAGEIADFRSKANSTMDVDSDVIAMDHDGHPLKEIFELHVGSSIVAQFLPTLHFGEVTQDLLLANKALSAGLNALKGDCKPRVKKYQLMTIKCTIPFLDVLLMGNNPDLEHERVVSKRNKFQEDFRICFEDTDVSIERNAPPEWTQAQINSLDEDVSTYHYGPAIQGGLIAVTIKHVMCTLHPLNLATPLVHISNFAINGYLHLAGLSPTTEGIQEGKTVSSMLLCHHNYLASKRISARIIRNCGCSYGVTLDSASIPVKLYADGRITCGALDIAYGGAMAQSIPRLVECIQRLLPPPPKSSGAESTLPLPWWDNVRFFVHGKISISADELSFRWLLDSHTFRDQSILLTCENCDIRHSVGSFTIEAKNVNVSTPGTTYDMSVHPSESHAKPTFHLPHEAESVVSKERHPLIHVPSFNVQIRFRWEMLQRGRNSSGHHSVYVFDRSNATTITLGDKFAPFRSDGVHVHFEINLPGSDGIGADNWVALRLDILPWFTHINSAISYSQGSDQKAEPFPQFRSVAMQLSVTELKVATWFEDDKGDFDGLCLIIPSVSHCAAIDGSKDISIEGPVKAALLDMSDFASEFKSAENSDPQEDDDMATLEEVASEFGGAQSMNLPDDKSGRLDGGIPPTEDKSVSAPFLKIQQLSNDIDELDYVINSGPIDVRNQSLAKILSEEGHGRNKMIERKESLSFASVDMARTTWSILVARCRLLWTIEIRDSIMAVSKDLIYVIGFIKSQNRQRQLLLGDAAQDESVRGLSSFGDEVELSICDHPNSDRTLNQSMLGYLLRESFDDVSRSNVQRDLGDTPPAPNAMDENPTLPTLDILFCNPQVQLHSSATGGSIILACESAHVEGRKFVNFLVTNAMKKGSKIAPSDLLRKTEHTYTLTNMEAYSISADVDVSVGLPWLGVCTEEGYELGHRILALEERFGINDSDSDGDGIEIRCADTKPNEEREGSISSHRYPPDLRHHEPLAFLKSPIIRQILAQFTFSSRQLFHRPPVHYSTEELIQYIKQGLVVGQDGEAVDDIELLLDELRFNLDSYQFKTTLDVIRNVLLEPPKLHQRHQGFDQDEASTARKSSVPMSSVAGSELEAVMKQHETKHRGKREVLRTAAIGLLRDLEDRIAIAGGNKIFRRISYSLSKLQWLIQNEDEIDDVAIAFVGFYGQHDYSLDGSVVSQISLEDVRVSSTRPGPDSIVFVDPTCVVKSVLGNERSPCQRAGCNLDFDHSTNDVNSCVYHVGELREGIWSCCNASNANAPGCKTGPHSGKERAAVVRVESLPKTVEGIHLVSHFEVNIYPGVPHTLVVQISKSISRLFMAYFFVDEKDEDDHEAASTSLDETASIMSKGSDLGTTSESSPKQTIRKKSLLIGGKGSPPQHGKHRAYTGPINSTANELGERSDSHPSQKKADIVFVKVLRVGNVDVSVSLGGFKRLPQTSLGLSVPAYSKAYELGTGEVLGRKYLTYLIREVLKSGASSGISTLLRRKVSPGQRADQTDFSTAESKTPQHSVPAMPAISDTGPSEVQSFIERHLRRPVGAADILGTPAKKGSKKKKKKSLR